MARFTETVDIRPVATAGIDKSPLIQSLEAFSQQKLAEGVQQVAAQNLAAGQAALQEGESPEFKKESFFGSVKAKSYNKGLRAAYVASIDRDNRLEVARITKENESDLLKFNDEIENYRKSVLNNVDPTARQIVQDSLDSIISANRIRVQTNEIEKNHKENAREVASQVDAAANDALGFARDGDDQSAAESALAAFASVDAAVDAGFVSPTQGAEQKRNIEKGLVEEKLKGGVFRTFESEGMQKAYGMLNDMADKRSKGFTPDEWEGFITETQTELNRRVARAEREAALAEAQRKQELDFAAIEKRLDGDDAQIVNPKVADAYYQQRVLPAVENLPSEARQAVQANYIDRLKVVPNMLVSEITNAANSNNPDLLNEAASLMDRIDEIPGVVNKVPKQQQAYLDTVVGLMQNMSPTEAVDLARRATDPKDKARIESVNSVLKEIKKDDPQVFFDRSRSAFRSIFTFGDPEPDSISHSKMADEYQNMFESFMRAGTSEADAFKKADKFIKRTWGKSTALGKNVVMKYPPEDYYSIDGDASWIKPELMKDVRDQVAGSEIDDVFLMANDMTSRTAAAGRPSYAVTVLIDGSFYPVGNWSPDIDSEIQRRKEQKVSDALKSREERLKGVDINGILRSTKGL